MSQLLRIVLDTGLFFITCSVIFLFGFIVDAWAQARRARRRRHRGPRQLTTGREGEGVEPAPPATT